MTSSGPFYPTAAADAGGGSSGPWTGLSNLYASDDSYASGAIPNGGDHTSELLTTGYGFAIPSTATINGILVEVERHGFQAADSGVQLLKSGTPVGSFITGSSFVSGTDAYAPFGGSSNLWGTTWTPAEINSSTFGVDYSAQNTHGGGDISVDTIRVTVYWTAYLPPQDPNEPKKYIYKVYDNTKNYLGNLPPDSISSDFQVSQDINSAGSQVTIELAQTIDLSDQATTDTILDETGAAILDESGNALLSEGSQPIIGTGISSTLIKNGNKVVVWEYSYYWPNGHVVFQGEIERWETDIGSDSGDTITLYVYGNGSDLDNMLLLAGVGTGTVDQSQTSQNSVDTISSYDNTKFSSYEYRGQSFTVGTGITNVGQIDLLLNGTATVTIKIYDSAALTTLLASITQYVSTSGAQVVSFSLSPHIIVVPGNSYFFGVSVDINQSINIYYQNTNVYSGGTRYAASYTGFSGGGYFAQLDDLWFKTYSTTGATVATFTNQDPSTGMLKPFIDDYVSRGGLINYGTDSIDPTGLSLTYQFNTNTVLEGIKAMLSISPFGFYWYVDPSTNTLYFKQASSTANILLIKGVHIEKLKLVATIENIVNKVFFVGGNSGSGTNLYKTYQDAVSSDLYGNKLERKTDNRVTVAATANSIGNSMIQENKDEQFQTKVTVTDKSMDISSLRVGMIVGFRGFGSFVDTILSQIVRIDYTPDYATLTLGTSPPRLSLTVEQATRELIALQTIYNPTSPS